MFTLVKTLETEIKLHAAECPTCNKGGDCYSAWSKQQQLTLEQEIAELIARLELVLDNNRQVIEGLK